MERETTVPKTTHRRETERLENPPIVRAMFKDIHWGWLWLILRLYAGYEWVTAGLMKLQSPAWVGPQAGSAISGFIKGALGKTTGEHADVQGWYAAFLQNVVLPNAGLFSHLVAYGEFIVGVALILGFFTGITAFFGGFLNANYLLAGSVSTNPFLFAIAMLLVAAWRSAGWWGIDRWLLPAVGTPWRPGTLFRHKADDEASAPAHAPRNEPRRGR